MAVVVDILYVTSSLPETMNALTSGMKSDHDLARASTWHALVRNPSTSRCTLVPNVLDRDPLTSK